MTTTNSKKEVHSANDVANFFIWKANEEGKPITNKKLQKLLYYSQAWSLALDDKPLFKEDVEAWVHGPAVKNIYAKFRRFGYQPITINIKKEDIDDLIKNKLLKEIWRVYGKYDAQYLEQLTHEEEPWQKAREGLEINENSDKVITHIAMKAFYSNKLK